MTATAFATTAQTALLIWALALLPSSFSLAGSFGFSEPKVVNGNYLTAENNSYVPDIAADGETWVVVWYTWDDIFGLGYDANIYSTRSTDGGDTWTSPTLVNQHGLTHGGVDAGSRIDTDGFVWICSWLSHSDLDGTTGNDGDILYSRSLDGGITWEIDRPLNSNATSDSGYDLLQVVRPAGDGTWLAIWGSKEDLTGTIGTDFDVFYSRSEDSGATWDPPRVLNSSAETSSSGATDFIWTDAATDGNGNWVAVWSSRDDLGGTVGADYDILYARSSDNGTTWTETRPLNSNAASDTGADGYTYSVSTIGPAIRTDRAGNWVTIWSSLDTLGGTLGDDADILFARSTDNGATWTDPLPLNSNAVDDPEGLAGSDTSPWLATDANGTWIAIWMTTAFSGPSYGDLDPAVAKSTDSGRTWTPIAPLNMTATADYLGYDDLPRLVADGSGSWVCTWETTAPEYGQNGLYKIIAAASHDIEQPASPPFWNKAIETLIMNIILGHQIVDVNGDGSIDIADLLVVALQMSPEKGGPHDVTEAQQGKRETRTSIH